jgi:transposase
MTTREKVLLLAEKGISVAEISEKIGVSKQRVYQILAHPVVSKSGRPPAPLDHLEAGEPARKPPLTDKEIKKAKEILKKGEQWTWHSAYSALTQANINPAANQVYEFLKEIGFEYSRNDRNWKKGSLK